ncbi:hypothetical protein PMMJPKLI_00055 [Klebsiella phage KP13MC5-1]|nr:hypothetical protein PMMJPKLI_00055 [Klebsiella phage KP13MC5-1]
MKNKTLDKFITTRLEIKKTNVKTVHLPDGTAIEIPKMSYRHFVKIKTLKDDPVAIMRFIIDDIKPRELTAAEIEFVLIHMYAHNNADYANTLKEIGLNLDDLKISEPCYDFTFDNVRLVFDKPSLLNAHLPFLIKEAYVDGKPVELTEDKRDELINCLYRFEYDQVSRGVLQEVYIIHEGKTIKGLNIIGE